MPPIMDECKLTRKNQACVDQITAQVKKLFLEIQNGSGYGAVDVHANIKEGEADLVEVIGKAQYRANKLAN